jgi:hypothetical protein
MNCCGTCDLFIAFKPQAGETRPKGRCVALVPASVILGTKKLVMDANDGIDCPAYKNENTLPR